MEQGIILCCRQWKLKNIPDEIRHDRAATAPLRVQMADIRHRHIVGECKRVVPIWIPVEGAGSEPFRAILSYILIYSGGALQELTTLSKQIPVMIEVVDIYLKAPLSHSAQDVLQYRVSFLRDNLKGSLYSE